MKYSTDDGNISPQSISGAPVSTTLYPFSYHDQFPPGPEDVLQGSPTLNASPSPRMPPAAIDDIPHASFSNENNAPSNVVIEGDVNLLICQYCVKERVLMSTVIDNYITVQMILVLIIYHGMNI